MVSYRSSVLDKLAWSFGVGTLQHGTLAMLILPLPAGGSWLLTGQSHSCPQRQAFPDQATPPVCKKQVSTSAVSTAVLGSACQNISRVSGRERANMRR